MALIEMAGWIALAAGALVIASGAWAACGKLWWLANWKWGDACQMRRSVRLGWNTGAPPEGEIVLVREHADGVMTKHGRYSDDFRWALMIRRSDRAHSLNGGYSTPITNITGWLYTTEETAP